MDKNSNVGTQYIICECGDNFPDEKLLNIHLATDHGGVDLYQCDACTKYFPTKQLLQEHSCEHAAETPLPITSVKPKNAKKPPVIKLRNLKRIDSISLIQSLKSYSGLIKLEPAPQEMDYQVQEEPSQLLKSEVQDQEVATEEIYYQCDVCNTVFYTESDFNVHYQSTHAMKVEPTPEEILEDHLMTDHSCDVNVKAEAAAEAEVDTETDTAYYYECEICHKIFASEEYFNIHYSRVHGGLLTLAEEPDEPEEPGEPEAEPVTVEPDTLKVMQEEEDEIAEEEQEELATVEKETDYSIEEYKAPHKAAEQVIYYKCDLCKILYPSEKAYNTHFDKKHGSQQCLTAPIGYKFIEQDLSGETRRPPPGEDVFCCEFCPKTFVIKRSLQVHRKRVHADRLPAAPAAARQPSRSKVCDICGRAYNSNAALRYHQRRHTGEKPYPCTLCPKRFTMPMFLQIHMRTHTGEKPYECPHCPKAFTNKAALIRHDRVHTGIKPYPCPQCGKFFTQSNSMKLHVSTVHLKLPAPYKSKNRRDKSEARALQLALKSLPPGEAMDD